MINKLKEMPASVLVAFGFLASLVVLGAVYVPWIVIPLLVLLAIAASVFRIIHRINFERR